MDPRLNFYNGRAEPITTPAVRSRPNRDLYLNLLAFERDGSSATFSVIVEPLVFWIWFGGFVVAIGGLIAMLPPRRRAPRRAAEKIAVEVA
jgi:cytochrome c-type biogenesis protein CcmF